MKKLLILLLLIPTLIQAEEFNLVCEGEELYTFASRDGWKDKKIIVVKVREESIRIDNSTYSTQKYNNSAGNFCVAAKYPCICSSIIPLASGSS